MNIYFGGKQRLLVLWLVAGALVSVPVLIAARAFWAEYASFVPPSPRAPVDVKPGHAALPRLVEVTIPNQAGDLRGWFVPGKERGAVILLHGCGGNRTELLPEIEILSRAGLGTLAFDWPGSGESDGISQWGASEIGSLRVALDWLRARPEVDPRWMGLFAFSLSTWIALREAGTDPRFSAVALAGAPASMVDFGFVGNPFGGKLSQWAGMMADRARGMPVGTDEPMDIVKRIAPTPLLLIAGSEDQVVPAVMTEELFASASEPKQLLVIPHAGHGEYAKVGGKAYADRLASFFVDALNSKSAAMGRDPGERQ